MKKPSIMVVDDQQTMCNLISGMLKETYDIKTFTEGKDAMQYMSEQAVDLVLLDYEMPTMNGYEVLMELRNGPRTADLPVIIVTSNTDQIKVLEMQERGASDYITKPIDFTLLRQRIKKFLRAGAQNEN